MGIGAAGLAFRGRNLTSEEGIQHTIISVFIPVIAMTMYAGMAMGLGIIEIPLRQGGSQTVFWMRYGSSRRRCYCSTWR